MRPVGGVLGLLESAGPGNGGEDLGDDAGLLLLELVVVMVLVMAGVKPHGVLPPFPHDLEINVWAGLYFDLATLVEVLRHLQNILQDEQDEF